MKSIRESREQLALRVDRLVRTKSLSQCLLLGSANGFPKSHPTLPNLLLNVRGGITRILAKSNVLNPNLENNKKLNL